MRRAHVLRVQRTIGHRGHRATEKKIGTGSLFRPLWPLCLCGRFSFWKKKKPPSCGPKAHKTSHFKTQNEATAAGMLPSSTLVGAYIALRRGAGFAGNSALPAASEAAVLYAL